MTGHATAVAVEHGRDATNLLLAVRAGATANDAQRLGGSVLAQTHHHSTVLLQIIDVALVL